MKWKDYKKHEKEIEALGWTRCDGVLHKTYDENGKKGFDVVIINDFWDHHQIQIKKLVGSNPTHIIKQKE